MDAAKRVTRQVMALFNEFVSADGSAVDYRAMVGSRQFVEYLHAAYELTVTALTRAIALSLTAPSASQSAGDMCAWCSLTLSARACQPGV